MRAYETPKMSKSAIMTTVLISLSSILIAIVLIPWIITSILLLVPARAIVLLLARIFRPDLSGFMFGVGQMFACQPVYTQPLSNIIIHVVINGTVSVDNLRSRFQQRILLSESLGKSASSYAHLQQRWTRFLGFFFWQQDPDFRLENHIRLYDYTGPDLALNEICTEDDLRRITGPLLSKPYLAGRSPWEMLVIPSYKSSDSDVAQKCVIVLKIHHAMADGISIVKLLLRLFDSEGSAVAQAKFRRRSWPEQLITNLQIALIAPYDLAVCMIEHSDGENCWHLTGKELSRQYCTFFSDAISVDTVRAAMKKYGVSYNAVIFTVVVGSVLEMMKEVGQKVPEKISTNYPYPLENHPGGLVNHTSMDSFAVYPKQDNDTLKRLARIAHQVRPATQLSRFPHSFNWLGKLMFLQPAWLIDYLRFSASFTLIVSNVPGPSDQLDVLEQGKVEEIIAALGHGVGNNGAIAFTVSAAGKQKIVLTVDKVIFEDHEIPSHFPQYVKEELDALMSSNACKFRTNIMKNSRH